MRMVYVTGHTAILIIHSDHDHSHPESFLFCLIAQTIVQYNS